MPIQDSGERRIFESGAVRDIQEGKGRCDLLPLGVVASFMSNKILGQINLFVERGNKSALEIALEMFISDFYNGRFSHAMLDVAIHYEEGCNKYGDRNWELGIPLHCFIDSGVRHYLKHLRGDTDENHGRAFVWNMLGAIWTVKNRPECCDLPCFEKEENK